MSLFSGIKKKQTKKRRDAQCKDIQSFIQVHFVRERDSARYAFNTLTLKSDPDRDACVEWYEKHGNPTSFAKIVECYVTDKALDTALICSKAGLEPQYFDKLFVSEYYRPGKGETLALCIGLKLNLEETRALLKVSDYSLTNSIETDLIARYFIENKIYSLGDLNYALQTLGGIKLKDL